MSGIDTSDPDRPAVTPLPPPAARPRLGGPQPDGDTGRVSETGRVSDAPGRGSRPLPFDGPREAVTWWFAPVVAAPAWLALGYLFVGAITMTVFTGLVVAMLVTGLALVVVAVGVPHTLVAFAVSRSLAAIERHRARWVGSPIPARPLAEPVGSLWARFRDRITDPEQWRLVAFFPAGVVVVPTLFAVAAGGWAAVISVASSAVTERDLLTLTVTILLTGAVARLAVLTGTVAHSFVAWFLGPDRTTELEARVDSLSTQRQEILDAVAAERRRIERNLHDGVQQQLVALGIDIGRAAARIESDPDEARRLLDDAREKVHASVGELRMIGRGLHPAILDDRGLDAALSSVVAGAPIPIEIDVEPVALPLDLAETAYFVANEAVANTLKHAGARVASVHLSCTDDVVTLIVHDDGRGGAERHGSGTGLAGMAARVAAVDGRLVVDSPEGGPTVVTATFPLTGPARLGRDPGGPSS